MISKMPTNGPEVAATTDRAKDEALENRFNSLKLNDPNGESLVKAIIARRFELTMRHAQIVCQKAGIGGRNE